MLKTVEQSKLDELVSEAKNAPRRRSHHNLHDQLDAPVQRLIIGLVKGTYIQPHCHPQSNKWELMVVLRGHIGLLLFNADGLITGRHELAADDGEAALEIPAGVWHSVFPLSESAVMLEVKEGPYTPTRPECFAPWAPSEGESDVSNWLAWAATAECGDKFNRGDIG